MKVPDRIYSRIKDNLWRIAREIEWPMLSDSQKSSLYEEWIRNPEIGGVLSQYIDKGSIRVYIKDTILKPFSRELIKDFSPIIQVLDLPDDIVVLERYTKPHGRLLISGELICWGLARNWKAILMAVFERAYKIDAGCPYAAVMLFPRGKCQQTTYRQMVEEISFRMGIEHLIWADP